MPLDTIQPNIQDTGAPPSPIDTTPLDTTSLPHYNPDTTPGALDTTPLDTLAPDTSLFDDIDSLMNPETAPEIAPPETTDTI